MEEQSKAVWRGIRKRVRTRDKRLATQRKRYLSKGRQSKRETDGGAAGRMGVEKRNERNKPRG